MKERVDEDVKKYYVKLLGISVFALFAFGVFAQVLSEMMGYTPMLAEYLLSLLPTVAVGVLVYLIVVKLRQCNKLGKAALAVLLVVMFGWTVFVASQLLEIQFDPRSQEAVYGNGWYRAWADLKEETRYMLSKCHPFGHGDTYYQYSENLVVSDVYNIENLPFEAREATMERDRAEIFRNFRFNATLPVLSYTYGFWVTLLFAGITIVWCIAAVGSFRRLNVWWEKALYAICGFVIAEQLVFPLLGGLGIVACLLPHPFASEWRITVTSVTPQLSIMFALLKTSKPKVTTGLIDCILDRRESFQMKFLSKLFRKRQTMSEPTVEAVPPKKQEPKQTESAYLTATVTFGMHPYRSADEDSSVFFVDENRGIRKMIIDSRGNIQNFPGVVKEDFWVKHVAPNYLKQQVRFRSSFEKRNDGWIFLWQLQPDGWYWADEGGFGAENDSEVVLYTYLDLNGDFTGPFRIYKLDSRGYSLDRFLGHHTSSQKRAMEAMSDNEPPVTYPGDIFPQLLGGWTNYVSEAFYHLRDKQETLVYWNEPTLSHDMKELAQAMLNSEKTLWQMMGRASNRVQASMTLFWLVTEEPVFKHMLDKFYDGKLHEPTVKRLREG